MLEMTDGGRCVSGLDAIEFFEMLAAGEDIDIDAKTPEFCDDYEHALNRLRYEVRKSVPVPPKIQKAYCKGHKDSYSCGACGYALHEETDKYCPNCGRAIAKYKAAWAGEGGQDA